MGASAQAYTGAADTLAWGERATRLRDVLLISLTFAAGSVDAVSYLGLGQIFTANMTGNVVFLALAVGERSIPTAIRSVGALVGFSIGAIVAGQILAGSRATGPWPRRVTWLLWGELACMAAFAVLWASTDGNPGEGLLSLLIGLSSFGMGFQNAAARHLSVPGLTTTVVTTALTGFMVNLPVLGISGAHQRRAALSVVTLFSGAAVGAALMVYARTFAPYVTVADVAVVAAAAYVLFDESDRARAWP
jgi:uncharacterized membrane protein YoaK (UPF0700 family)